MPISLTTVGFLEPEDAWDTLSMNEKAEMMKVAISHGIYNLDDIRKKYNEFAEGGCKEEPEKINTNNFSSGGSIYIKPENRGKFTALKKRTEHSASWFKEHGTPAQKKMAVFALNSRKWKHGEGGNLFDGEHWPTQQMNVTYGRPYYSYDENGRKVDDTLNFNASPFPDIIITPSREPIGIDRIAKGVNINSNSTVGKSAKEAGEAAVREKNRKTAEDVALFNSQNEMNTLFPVGEVSGETTYKTVTQPKVIGMSGADPIGEMFIAGELFSPLFKFMPSISIGAKSVQKFASGSIPWTVEEAKEAAKYANGFFKNDVLPRLQASRIESENPLFTKNSPFLGRFTLTSKPANIPGETSPLILKKSDVPYTVEINKNDLSSFDDKLNTIFMK